MGFGSRSSDGREGADSSPPRISYRKADRHGTPSDRSAHSSVARAYPQQWVIGDLVDNLYEVREVITRGGMGLVYRVHHRGWDVELAVKTPNADSITSPDRLRDFENEAHTWVQLGLHPHVVACAYVRRMNGLPRVFAEWVHGGSLAQAVSSRRLYDGGQAAALARILDVAIQFGWGLDFAHSRGLIHQDVKPDNVMLTLDGTAKVTDFGLARARAVAQTPQAGTSGASIRAGFAGFTLPYCSPEQAEAAASISSGPPTLSRATDVWSWAISLWEMFTGSQPVTFGQVADEVFRDYLADRPARDGRIPAMPPSVADLLSRCLTADRERRPRDIGSLTDELAHIYLAEVGGPYPRVRPTPTELVADGLNNHALSMLDLGKPEQARHLWREALGTDSHHLHSVYNYGLDRWRRGQITDVDLLSELRVVDDFHPGDPTYQRLVGCVHLERGDQESARRSLALAGEGHEVSTALSAVRDLDTAEPVVLHTPGGPVSSMAVTPDGQTVVFCHTGRSAFLWQVGDGTRGPTRRLTDGTAIEGTNSQLPSAVSLSDDGRTAVVSTGLTRVYDVAGAEFRREFADGYRGQGVVSLACTGRFVIAGTFTGHADVWDNESGALVRTLTGHRGGVHAVAGAMGRLAVTGSDDGQVAVWDLDGGACLHRLQAHAGGVRGVAVTRAADIAVSAGDDGAIKLWNLADGRCVRTLSGHAGPVLAVAITADGRWAVSGGDDATVRVWELENGRCRTTLTGHTGAVRAVALTDGCVFSAGSDASIRVWPIRRDGTPSAVWSYLRPRSAESVSEIAAEFDSALRHADWMIRKQRWAVAADVLRTAADLPGFGRHPQLRQRWQVLAPHGRRSRLVATRPSHVLDNHGVESAAVTVDGSHAVSGDNAGSLRCWNVESGRCLSATAGSGEPIGAVALSADGRRAVSSGPGTMVRVWAVPTLAEVGHLDAHRATVRAVALAAHQPLAVSGDAAGRILFWNRDTRALHADMTDQSGPISALAIDAAARTVVSASWGSLTIWDLATESRGATLYGHSGFVTSVALSSDGAVAVSSSEDGSVRVWDTATGACVRSFSDHAGRVNAVTVSSDGRTVLACGVDQTVRGWDVATGMSVLVLSAHRGAVRALAATPDLATVLTTGNDSTVRCWSLDWEYEFDATETAIPTRAPTEPSTPKPPADAPIASRRPGDASPPPQDLVARGLKLKQQGDVSGAVAAWQSAIASGHRNWAPAAAVMLGVHRFESGDTEGALSAFQSAIDSGNSAVVPTAAIHLSILYSQTGDTARAEAMSQLAIDSGHSDYAPMAAVNLGMLRERRGDLTGAASAYVVATTSGHPEHAPKAAVNLGNIRRTLGDSEGAVAAWQVAIDSGHTEHCAKAANNLALLRRESGDAQGSAAAWRIAADSGHPEWAPKAQFNLGVVLHEFGDVHGAAQAWLAAAQSDHPDAPMSANNLGGLRQDLGDPEGAAAAWQLAIDSGHAEQAPMAAFNLGRMRYERSEFGLAAAAWQLAIDSRHPQCMPAAAYALGVLRRSQGDQHGATIAWRLAVESGHPQWGVKAREQLDQLL